jgi:hypothetical protein
MKVVRAYDDVIFKVVETILRWCHDWLSLEQRRIERSVIFLWLYVAISADIIGRFWIGLLIEPFIAFSMLTIAPRSDSERMRRRKDSGWLMIRLAIQFLFVFYITFDLLSPTKISMIEMLRHVNAFLYAFLMYSIAIGIDGERGSKRKLALAKLKELFGAEWIPRPLPTPQ